MSFRRTHNKIIVVAALVAALVASTTPVVEATVSSTIETGNPSCADLGLEGLKITTSSPVGTYSLPGLPGESVKVSLFSVPTTRINWEATYPLDAVIVKGRDGSSVYRYNPAAKFGTELFAPRANDTTDAQINFIHVCWKWAATVTASNTDALGANGVDIHDIPLAALPANLLNRVAGADLVNDAGTGLRFSGTSLRFSGTSLRFSGTGLRFSGTGLRFSGTSLRFSGTSLRFSGTGLRFSGTGLRFSGDGIGALVDVRSAKLGGLEYSGTGLRFSGTSLRFSDLPAWDIPLSDLQPPQGFTWNDVFVAIGTFVDYPPQNVTFGQLLDALSVDFTNATDAQRAVLDALATMSLLDLDPNGAVLRDVSLVALLLGNTPLSAIPLPSGATWCETIDPENTGCTDADIGDTTVMGLNLAGLHGDNLPLDKIALSSITPNQYSVLADLLTDSGQAGDLYVPAVAGDTLASYLVRGIDALNVPWEQLPLISPKFDVRQYALGSPVTFSSSWAETAPATRQLQVSVPAGFVLAKGSPSCVVSSGTCTATADATGKIVVTTAGSSGLNTVDLHVSYRPQGLMDETTPSTAGSFTLTAGANTKTFRVTVNNPWFGVSPPPIAPDVLYFETASTGDIDRYDVDVSKYAPGSHVAVRLSNLTSDADLVLYRSAGTSLRFSGTGMRFSGTSLRFSGTSLRFSGDTGDQSVDNRESETLEDVPIDQSLIVEDVSANRSNSPEAADGFTDPATTKFQVQVSGFNNPVPTQYALRVAVTEFGDACTTTTPTTASVRWPVSLPDGSTTVPAGTKSVVLFPREQFTDRPDQIDNAIASLAAAPWNVAVGFVTTSGTDYRTVTGACSVYAANAVAEQVAAAVQKLPASVEHVMIIGGDDKLPFYRTPDTTLIANEANYASTVGGTNPLTAALGTQNVLTDDIYGDNDPWPFLNRLYFTPDRAVGRLVESTDDIVGQIDRFVQSNGKITVDRTFTAGYDFLSDVAGVIDQNLADLSGNRSTLINESWSVANLSAGLSGSDGGASVKIASINSHMDQGLLLSAAGNAQGDNVTADQIAKPNILPAGINGAVLFTAGCHAGLNQPYSAAERTDDWAQALAGKPAAFYLANTGYGYGLDQPIVGYSEELLANFSDLLELDGMTVGQAAMYAKQQYFSKQLEIDPYDEKSQMQLTTYGVPMYSLTGITSATSQTQAAAAGGSAVTATVIDPVSGLASASLDSTTSFSGPLDGGNGTSYYALTGATANDAAATPGFEAANGKPIQPKFTADVTAPDPSLIARGVFVESLSSRSVNLDKPTVARATIDNTTTEAAADSGTVIFPTAFANVQTEQTAAGPRGKLVVVPAQFDSENANEQQLLVDSLTLRTYYAKDTSEDFVRPQFGDVSANFDTGDILFRASITDPDVTVEENLVRRTVPGTGVKRMLAQYLDNGVWKAVEMFPANATRTEWSGGLRTTNNSGVFFVQAVDGAGNVAVTANKGKNYVISGDPAQAVAFVSGVQGDNGWYVGNATQVELKGKAVSDGNTYTVTINGATQPPYTGGPFPVATEGRNTVTIFGEGAQPIELTVPIDTRPPIVNLENPIKVLTVDPKHPEVVRPVENFVVSSQPAACDDPTPGSGLRDLDLGDPANACELTENDYSLPVGGAEVNVTLKSKRGQDIAGNVATESETAVILAGTQGNGGYYTSPVILGVLGGTPADLVKVYINGSATPFDPNGTITISIPKASVKIMIGDDDEVNFDVVVDDVFPEASVILPTPATNRDLGTFDLNSSVPVTCMFGDAGSGVASKSCGGVNGTEAFLTTTASGNNLQFVVTATDLAGNTTTTIYTYSVRDSYVCDSATDGLTPAGNIWKCASKINPVVNGKRTATVSIIVTGQIDPNGTQYRLRVASSASQTGTLVKWVGSGSLTAPGSISGKPLVSASIPNATTTANRLDFVIDLGSVGVASGGTLYWAAETQSGEKGKAGAGFLDTAPDTCYFKLTSTGQVGTAC